MLFFLYYQLAGLGFARQPPREQVGVHLYMHAGHFPCFWWKYMSQVNK